MNICCIIPPSIILSDPRVFIHLGILRVAAVLRQAGHLVHVLDLTGVENYPEAVTSYVTNNPATKTFAITATSPQLPPSVTISQTIRKTQPGARVILGGPHMTLVNAPRRREAKAGKPGRGATAFTHIEPYFDVFVAGDGERAIFEAIKESPAHIIDADDPQGKFFLSPDDLNALPLPARDLVDLDSYKYTIDNIQTTTLIAQLGCPFGCAFCGGRLSPTLRRVRLRTTASIIEELRQLHERYGFSGFMFYDDELNVNKEVIGLMRAITALAKSFGVEFALRGFVKAELFTDEQAAAMREAGFRDLLVGFESGSPRVLKNIGKGATLQDNTQCFIIARHHDLRIKALMSIGHPGESDVTINETRDWLLAMKPESFDITRLTVYPGTPYFDEALPVPGSDDLWVYTARNGDRLFSRTVDCTRDYVYYKGDRGDRDGLNKFYAWTDYLNANELKERRDQLEIHVRGALSSPFQFDPPLLRFDASMGQFPEWILKKTEEAASS